jgi:NADH-quinone oxidoreductase subunit M
MLIPMYFIIAIWGHENKRYAATKFFLFTQFTGMLLLVSLLCLVYFFKIQYGYLSFAYEDLLRTEVDGALEIGLMLGFFIAFATKLPSVPFHSWLPDAHSQAPTAGSVASWSIAQDWRLWAYQIHAALFSRGVGAVYACRTGPRGD